MPRLNDPGFWQPYLPRLRREFVDLVMDILMAGGDAGAKRIPLLSVFIDWDVFNQDALDWLDMYLGGATVAPLASGGAFSWALSLLESTRRGVAREIDRWIRAGAALPELERRLEPFFDKRRAHRVAVTEVTRVYASGNILAWKASGVVDGKRWQTAVDERVCPICSRMHNTFVDLDRGWEFTPAMLAADPALARAIRAPLSVIVPPAHVNCLLPGTEVVAPGRIRYATKGFYSGRCIEIRTASGRVLAVTENHPILTRRGWIPAQFVRQLDHVFSSAEAERVASVVSPDYDHVPTAIEEVFSTFQETGGMVAGHVPVAAEDFHGDGRLMNGDIEIVFADGFLSGNGQSGGRQPSGKLSFFDRGHRAGQLASGGRLTSAFVGNDTPPSGGMGMGNLPLSGACIHTLPLGALRLGLTADGYTLTTQISTEGTPTDTQLSRQAILGFTGQIAGSPGREIVYDNGLMAAPVVIDTGGLHGAGNGMGADIVLAREFCDRFAGQVAADEVIEVKEYSFSGHVYNLQVDPYSLYFANGIIAHNCRCWLQPVVLEALTEEEIGQGAFSPIGA